jgi:hypothetical protein
MSNMNLTKTPVWNQRPTKLRQHGPHQNIVWNQEPTKLSEQHGPHQNTGVKPGAHEVEWATWTSPKHRCETRSPRSWVCVVRYLVFCVMFYRSLFVLLSFFFWSLHCLSFTLRFQITCLVGIFSFICMFYRSLFVLFLLIIALSVLHLTVSDYLFGRYL